MSHRKHGDDIVVVVAGNVALAEIDGGAEALVAEHDSLGVAG